MLSLLKFDQAFPCSWYVGMPTVLELAAYGLTTKSKMRKHEKFKLPCFESDMVRLTADMKSLYSTFACEVLVVLQCFALKDLFFLVREPFLDPHPVAMSRPSGRPSSAASSTPKHNVYTADERERSPTRPPIPLASRLWSCSTLRDGQRDVHQAKLEPGARDVQLAGLRRDLEALNNIFHADIHKRACI